MRAKPATSIDDPRYVKALGHPLRVRILALLGERAASPRELTEWLDASLGTVSYHVRTLRDSGLIELVRTNQVRGAIAHHYRARARPAVSEEVWAAAPPIAKQAWIGAELQTVAEYARAAEATGGFARGEAQLTRTNLRLDSKGWQQAAKACEKLLAQLATIEQATAKRITTDPHAEGHSDATLAMMLFDVRQAHTTGPHRPSARRKTKR